MYSEGFEMLFQLNYFFILDYKLYCTYIQIPFTIVI